MDKNPSKADQYSNIREHPVFKSTEGLRDFLNRSEEDLNECKKALKADKASMFWRRTTVRTAAAHIEGMIYFLKAMTLDLHPLMRVNFEIGEICMLREVSFTLNDHGKVQENSRQFMPFLQRFEFVINCFARMFHSSFKLNRSDHGFECFQKAVKLRDRLMHPKSVDSFEIGDEDMEIAVKGWDWFKAQENALMLDCKEGFDNYLKQFSKSGRAA